MNYGNIKFYDIANGEGIRTSLFVSGCTFECPGCFNSESQSFTYGQLYTEETEKLILDQVAKPYIAGLSILGGDPLCQDPDGIAQLTHLCQEVHKLGKNVWIWTGYTWENIRFKFLQHPDSNFANLIYNIDILVDGPFIESMKDPNIHWRGSRNQRVIDVQASYPTGQIYLKETQ